MTGIYRMIPGLGFRDRGCLRIMSKEFVEAWCCCTFPCGLERSAEPLETLSSYQQGWFVALA